MVGKPPDVHKYKKIHIHKQSTLKSEVKNKQKKKCMSPCVMFTTYKSRTPGTIQQ